jgi:hypothetical protein
MATFDQMIIDNRDLANRYFGENHVDNDPYPFSNLSANNGQLLNSKSTIKSDFLANTLDDNGLFGRRVYLESPSLGNKQDEDLYR